MNERFSRTVSLIGEENFMKLQKARVAVFGIGGVGGFVVEALARGGIGTLDLIDRDTVSISNMNRQIIALTSTLGRYKAEIAAERAKEINTDVKVNVYNTFYTPETAVDFDFSKCSGISSERLEKLNRIRPTTLRQATEISGIRQSDLALIALYVTGKMKK